MPLPGRPYLIESHDGNASALRLAATEATAISAPVRVDDRVPVVPQLSRGRPEQPRKSIKTAQSALICKGTSGLSSAPAWPDEIISICHVWAGKAVHLPYLQLRRLPIPASFLQAQGPLLNPRKPKPIFAHLSPPPPPMRCLRARRAAGQQSSDSSHPIGSATT